MGGRGSGSGRTGGAGMGNRIRSYNEILADL